MREVLQSLGRFLRRAFKDLPGSIGSNHLGIWFPVVPAVLFFSYQWRQDGWCGMRHDLLVGTVITLISYGLLFSYCVIRNLYREHVALVAKEKKTRQELEWLRDRPLWAGYASEDAWRAAIDEQNRLVSLGHAVDGVFSALQVEVLILAGDLRKFVRTFGERPSPQRGGEAWINDGTKEWMIARNNAQGAWLSNIVHSYADKYAARVKHAMHQLGAKDLPVYPLEPYTRTIVEESNITDAADILEKMALEVGALQREGKA